MREKLIQYVNFLFAGAPDAEDMKQEILQNTLDRFDDLVSEGKTPEAAYTLAISGIGDISDLLVQDGVCITSGLTVEQKDSGLFSKITPSLKKLLRAVAIATYIISIIPLIVLSEFGMETLGLCGTLVLVALATAMIIIASGGKDKKKKDEEPKDPRQKTIESICGTVTLCIYLAISFATGAWWITWLVFPISGAVEGLIKACIDLKEANKHES